jgi:hypothetical protein
MRDAANMLLQSEQVYSAMLHRTCDVIVSPLINSIQQNKLPVSRPTFVALFTKLQEVDRAMSTFLALLTRFASSADDTRVRDLFTELQYSIVCCFDYVNLFCRVSHDFRAEYVENAALQSFCQAVENELGHQLHAIMFLPLQRPLRYRQFVECFLQDVPDAYPDRCFLGAMLESIRELIRQIDIQIEGFEDFVVRADLQSRIEGCEIMAAGRRVYYCGVVEKFSRKTRDTRLIAVFNDALLVARPTIRARSFRLSKLCQSGDYMVVALQDNPPFLHAVDIRQREKSFRVNLPDAVQKAMLLAAFEKVKKVNKIETKQLALITFAPIWIPDDLAPGCMSCGAKFSVVNRRHHCRYCGEVICAKCFKRKIVCPGLGPEKQKVCPRCAEKILEMFGLGGLAAGDSDQQ